MVCIIGSYRAGYAVCIHHIYLIRNLIDFVDGALAVACGKNVLAIFVVHSYLQLSVVSKFFSGPLP